MPVSAPQSLLVFPAAAFWVLEGVAEGEPVSFADELVMDDIYTLAAGAARVQLAVSMDAQSQMFCVHPDSQAGQGGNVVHLDCCLTLMGADGATCEALVLVEVEDGSAAAVYLLPLTGLAEGAQYRLVGCDRHAATSRLAEVSCVSFTRGTRITMGSGEQRPIEQIAPGDKVLTRDAGSKEVCWIGYTTLRAVGSLAPVTIRKGALHNANDLIVSPDHRLFIYQRQDKLGAGRAEVLVKVAHLINGDTVVQQDGGFVDYFQLLFDDHQIIYAEGIAAESLLLDPRTRGAVPEHLTSHRHAARAHTDYEVTERLLSQHDAVDLLRHASSSG